MNSPLRTLTINAGSSSMHIDTDEANGAHLEHGGAGELVPVEDCGARITCRHGSAGGMDTSRRLHEPAGRQVTRSAGLIIVFLVLESRGA